MSEKPAHPLNVEGPFYVEHDCCTTCDLPRTDAPDMFRLTEHNDHCYVYQQPQTDEQMARMIRVMQCADLACVRCRSRDPELLGVLKRNGLRELCDYLPKSQEKIFVDFEFQTCLAPVRTVARTHQTDTRIGTDQSGAMDMRVSAMFPSKFARPNQ